MIIFESLIFKLFIMKSKLIKLFLCFIISLSFSFGQDNVNQKPSKQSLLNVKIEGMSCAVGCARSIETALNDNKGIIATVDFENSHGLIAYNQSLFSGEQIIDMINNYDGGKYQASVLISRESKCSKGKNCCQRTGKFNKTCDAKSKGCCAGSNKKCKKNQK